MRSTLSSDAYYYKDLYEEEKVIKWVSISILFIAIFLSNAITYQMIQNERNSKHMHSLMSYCEKITGKSQASFNSDGTFRGCETVIK